VSTEAATEPATEVRPATPADFGAMARALAGAFSTDPPLSWFIPDERSREPLLRRYFRSIIPLYLEAGAAWCSAEPAGAALWFAPERWPLRPRDQLARLPVELRVFGRWPRRGIGGLRALERHHPAEPHWYLDYIGVEPGAQGRGTGSALLAPMLARCDAEGTPAYLNAGSPRSRELYRRHGFEVLSELRLPFGGPPLWRMWRVPRTPG
jgi:GNAT superfamily N-acetyltransferase